MVGRERLGAMVAGLDRGEQADVLLERVLAEAHDASDDMTLCLIRPVAGAVGHPPRVEVLEFDSDDVESGFVARFIDACGVPAPDQQAAVARAHDAVSSNGLGLLNVTIAGGAGRAVVTAVSHSAAPPAAAV
jgi:hypothetical protein